MKFICTQIKPVLALIVMISGVAFLFLTTFYPPPGGDNQGITAMQNFMMIVLGYYLGTSTGGAKKDEVISELSKKQ